MKRLGAVLFLMGILIRSQADEGMWLAQLLGEQVYADMVKKGVKLSKDQLFSLNKSSIKDALILVNGKYTGSLVSANGLFFSSYQAAESALAPSSVDPGIRTSGFYAHTSLEEIPAKDSYADLLVRIQDVTAEMEETIKVSNGSGRAAKLKSAALVLAQKYSDPRNNLLAHVALLFKGNQTLVFVYERKHDLRLVALPPQAVAQFGGDEAEWSWPQFAGNFSVFRLYDNQLPYKPRYFLPISLKGYKEGDFALAYAFPALSNRYESSMGIRLKQEITDPALLKLFAIRRDFLREEMQKDPTIKTQLAPAYQWLVHEWKFIDGELRSLSHAPFYENRKNEEGAFQQWAGGKEGYETVFRDWNRLYSVWTPYVKHHLYVNVGMLGSPLMEFAAGLQLVENALVKQNGGNLKKLLDQANASRQIFLRSENKASDRKILAAMTRIFYSDIDRNQHPVGFYESLKGSFGDLKDENTYIKYVNAVFSSTFLFDDAKWNAFISNPDATVLQDDPAFKHASSFLKNWQNKYEVYRQQFQAGDFEEGGLYLKGLAEMDTKKIRYPDADSSLRLTYGSIRSYNPGASIHYDYICSMKGLLEKQAVGSEPRPLPPAMLELAKKKDFGPYLDKTRNDLLVSFTCTLDLTGTHSGSPVLNGNGELIGLAFDRNLEALGNHYGYTPLDRAICTDIRYVLWYLDKLAGASNLIHELKLVRQ